MKSFAIAICAPSGVGKTTVARRLIEDGEGLLFSVSATTRGARPGEQPGVDYHFISRDEFESMVESGELLEWAEVHGDLYGTPLANLEAAEREGKLLLLDIDVQGARQ
ncbi:MAG: guanylate kinase, partial [Planctomycetota bacterium]